MQKSIEELGLTEAESKVYISLLRKGSSLAGAITKETGIHRRTIYDILYRLRSKGLVSNIVINNKRYFEAVNPDRLLELIKEREDNIKKVLPELKDLYKVSKEKKEVVFFKGKQSIKTVFDDQIKENKEILFIGKGVEVNEIVKFYFPRFDSKRLEKSIPIKMIFDEAAKDITAIHKIPLAEIKYLQKWNESTMSTYIYGNNVSIVVWIEEPIAILIRQKEVADGFRNYFNIIWDLAEK